MPNLPTVLVGLVVLWVFVTIIVRGIRKRKNGRGGCSCGCSQCPSSDLCHPKEK